MFSRILKFILISISPFLFIAFDLKNNRNIALKTENTKSQFPLTIYEANVACILNGYGKYSSIFQYSI